MRKITSTLAVIVLLSGGSLAASILDQSQEQFTGRSAVFDQMSIAQTFTPSVGGQRRTWTQPPGPASGRGRRGQ